MTLTIRNKRDTAAAGTITRSYGQTMQVLEEFLFSHSFPTTSRTNSLANSQNSYGQISVSMTEQVAVAPARALLQVDRALEKLATFSALPVDWDSYGALPIQEVAVQQAKNLLQTPIFLRLLPAHNARLSIFPRRDGGVQIDIDGGPYPIEVVVSTEGETEYTFFRADQEVEQEFATLEAAVMWHYSGIK